MFFGKTIFLNPCRRTGLNAANVEAVRGLSLQDGLACCKSPLACAMICDTGR